MEYKVLHPLPQGRKIIKSVGEEYQVVKRGREYYGCGEEYNVKKGKQYLRPYNKKAVRKNFKGGRGEGNGNFTEENQDFKKLAVEKNIEL